MSEESERQQLAIGSSRSESSLQFTVFFSFHHSLNSFIILPGDLEQ